VPATARKINVTAKDLANEGAGGAYAELNVPWDGPAICTDVNDYDKTAKGGTKGWLADYEVETDSGNKLEFSVHISFNAKARWKLLQWAEAHGLDIEEGVNAIDPNDVIETECGVHIDFPRDDNGEPTSKYREIQEFFPLAELDEDPIEEALEEINKEIPPVDLEEDPEIL